MKFNPVKSTLMEEKIELNSAIRQVNSYRRSNLARLRADVALDDYVSATALVRSICIRIMGSPEGFSIG